VSPQGAVVIPNRNRNSAGSTHRSTQTAPLKDNMPISSAPSPLFGASNPVKMALLSADQRTRDRGAEQVGTLIERIGAKHREDKVTHELFLQIVDKDLAGSEQFGLAARRFEFWPRSAVNVTTSQR
jgi:hypothetical protein